MQDISLENIVDEVHILSDSTFISESIHNSSLLPNDIFSKNTNFEYDSIRAAPYGGSFAIMHSIFSESLSTIISIYDPSLQFISNIEFTESVQNFYMTVDDLLVVIFNTPSIGVYDQRGNQILHKKLSDQQEFIVASSFWEHGIIIATFAGNIYHVYDFSQLKIAKFANGEEFVPNLTSGIVLPPKPGEHGLIYFGILPNSSENKSQLLFIQKNKVKVLDFHDRILSAEYSSDFSLVMVLTPTSVHILDSLFRMVYAKLDVSNYSVIRACWCGNSTILVTTTTGLMMIGQSSSPCSFNISSDCYAFQDIDGARVISSSSITYLREASGFPLDFINKNTKSSSIQLFMAVSKQKDFATSDPLEKLRSVMSQAINGLLDAVTFFRNPVFIKQLLQIITRYKGECSDYNSERYQQVLAQSRVIINLANSPVNMPLTFGQLKAIGNQRLLTRLCNCHQHFIAFRVADYLNLSTEYVSSHWAHCLIFSHISNDEILAKLDQMENSIDRVDLATSAFELASNLDDITLSAQKADLAIQLLKTVKAKSRAVPLLIKRHEWAEAVEAAVESNDSSLLAYVLKSATEQNHDSIVRDCITKHLIALDGWLQLHPDDPQKAELLEKSGLLRESLFIRFKNGDSVDELISKAKESNDQLDLDLFEEVCAIKNVCNAYHIDYSTEMTTYELFDKLLERNDPLILKPAAKTLKLKPDEVITRKIHFAIRTNQLEKVDDAVKDASQEQIYFAFLNLLEENQKDLAAQVMKHLDKDDYLGNLAKNRFVEV